MAEDKTCGGARTTREAFASRGERLHLEFQYYSNLCLKDEANPQQPPEVKQAGPGPSTDAAVGGEMHEKVGWQCSMISHRR